MPNFHVCIDSYIQSLCSAEYVLQLSKIAEFITLGISENSFSTDIK